MSAFSPPDASAGRSAASRSRVTQTPGTARPWARLPGAGTVSGGVRSVCLPRGDAGAGIRSRPGSGALGGRRGVLIRSAFAGQSLEYRVRSRDGHAGYAKLAGVAAGGRVLDVRLPRGLGPDESSPDIAASRCPPTPASRPEFIDEVRPVGARVKRRFSDFYAGLPPPAAFFRSLGGSRKLGLSRPAAGWSRQRDDRHPWCCRGLLIGRWWSSAHFLRRRRSKIISPQVFFAARPIAVLP